MGRTGGRGELLGWRMCRGEHVKVYECVIGTLRKYGCQLVRRGA